MSTRIKLLLVICSVFVAAIAIGSNMGFKLNYTLMTNAAGNNANWIGVPYFYQTAPTANTICNDIGAGAAGDCALGTATQVAFFDTAANSYTTYICGQKGDFSLVPGRGYQVGVSVAGCTWKIVGSHDDSYDTTSGISFYANAAGNNGNWTAVPYHSTAPDSASLCTQINAACSNIVTQIAYFDTAGNSYTTYICGQKGSFNLVPGMSYQVGVNAASAANCWHPAHY